MSEGSSEQGATSEQEKLQAHVDAFLPVQRQAIATAQLAGCTFTPASRRETFYDNGYCSREVTIVKAAMPAGEELGIFDDVYEGAVACLTKLNGGSKPIEPNPDLFRLAPENEQPEPHGARRRGAGIDFSKFLRPKRTK